MIKMLSRGRWGVSSNNPVNPESIKGDYGTYNMAPYIKQVSNRKDEILTAVNQALKCINETGNYYEAVFDMSKAFEIIKSCNNEKRFGTVYMINTLYFLSKGEIPIYDKNVYKAIQALFFLKNPKDIDVSDAPAAKDSVGAVFRLVEYMWLLDKVFEKGRYEQSREYVDCEHVGFISRGLDRALWVYGQCTKEYKSKE